jgi:hypothetical protein
MRQRLSYAAIEPFGMRARGNLGHDASEVGMQTCLAFDHRRKH